MDGTISADVTDVCGTSVTVTLPVTVNAYVTQSVTISTANTVVCSGAVTSFNALPVNAGTGATYQWMVNGTPLPSSGTGFNTSTLNTGDLVSVILTSSEQCVTANGVSSNQIMMTVQPSVVP